MATVPVPTDQPRVLRRRGLDRELILDVAMAVLDSDGLDAVTMRRVATELETGPASLYAHVANKQELFDLLYDRVVATVAIPDPDPANWQEQVRQGARALRQACVAHRDLSRVAIGNVPMGPNVLRLADRVLAILIAGGVDPQSAAWGLDALSAYVSVQAYESDLRSPDRTTLAAGGFSDEWQHRQRARMAALPIEEFPYLVQHGHRLVDGDSDTRFEFGLDLILRGLASHCGPAAAVGGGQ